MMYFGHVLFSGRLKLFQVVHRPVCVLTGDVLTCFAADPKVTHVHIHILQEMLGAN